MLGTTRATFGYRDAPIRSIARQLRSRMYARRLQRVHLPDGVVLHADAGHPNRCYAWTGELSITVAAAVAALLRPGDTFIDVGAFTGQHSMRAMALVGENGQVVAVEPDPRSLTWLHRNLAGVDLPGPLQVVEAAVDVTSGTTRLRLEGISMSSVDRQHGDLEVAAVTLDALLRRWRPTLVKIDIEGHDARVIDSSVELGRPEGPVVIAEHNAGVERALQDHGLRTWKLEELAGPIWRPLYNVSRDLLAGPPGLDIRAFTATYTQQLERLRVLPRVSYVADERPDSASSPRVTSWLSRNHR